MTSIQSMTAPLAEVDFPAITICNVNPVSMAFLRSLNITDLEEKKAFIRQYIRGDPDEWEKHSRDGIEDPFFRSSLDELIIPRKRLNDVYGWNETKEEEDIPIARLAAQNCSDMLIYADFKAKSSKVYFYDSYTTATDYGICCWIHPKLDLEWYDDKTPKKTPNEYDWSDFLNIPAGVKSGIKNGFKMIIDVEGNCLFTSLLLIAIG